MFIFHCCDYLNSYSFNDHNVFWLRKQDAVQGSQKSLQNWSVMAIMHLSWKLVSDHSISVQTCLWGPMVVLWAGPCNFLSLTSVCVLHQYLSYLNSLKVNSIRLDWHRVVSSLSSRRSRFCDLNSGEAARKASLCYSRFYPCHWSLKALNTLLKFYVLAQSVSLILNTLHI